jgi:hypothetical protein
MIDLKSITHINIYDLDIHYDLIELNRYLPKFDWSVDYEYTGTLRIDCSNVVCKNIRLYWDEDYNITCTVDNFEVTANCTIHETIKELRNYLVEEWINLPKF